MSTNDWIKLLLLEIKPGIQLNNRSWVDVPYTPPIAIGASNKNLYFMDEADSLDVDGEFELWNSATDLTNWNEYLAGGSTINRESSPHRGVYCVRMDFVATYVILRQTGITLAAGTNYILSFWYKTTNGQSLGVQLFDSTSTVFLKSDGTWGAVTYFTVPAAADWTFFSLDFTKHASYTDYHFGFCDVGGAACSLYVDDAFICPKLTATMTETNYSTASLCSEIKSKMETAGAGVYTVSYSAVTNYFTIASTTMLYLHLTNTTNDIWPTIGFSTVADSTFALSHTGTIKVAIPSDHYYCDLNIGEIIEVEIDGTPLTKETSEALCEVTAGSFYHDFFSGRLYVHLLDGGNPSAFVSPNYTYNVVAFVWKCFSNRQGECGGGIVDFIPEGCVYPHFYEPVLRPGTLAELVATIADHFESAMQISFGSISIVNDWAGWYADIDTWYWGNKDARVRVGEIGNVYASTEKIFVGKVRNPVVSDEEVVFDLVDNREGAFQSIPTQHYDATTYPNIDPNAVGQPIPVLFGQKSNITPICVSTVAHIYKISATHFNDGADVFELQSIDAVYMKGVGLSLATHYTVDLHNGEITLTFDPGNAQITVDAKGIKDAFNMATGAPTGVYSENVADHWFFVLRILNNVPIAQLDLASFLELQTVRTQKVAWYLDQDTNTIDFNRLLQQTSLYHFLPLGNGTFAARYYKKTVPAGTLRLQDYDHKGYKKYRSNDGVFRDIFFRYDKDPTTGIWKTLTHTEANTEHNHDTKDPYTIDTALRDATEAASVLAFYVSLLKDPPTKINDSISMIGKSLIPTDKLINNRSVLADGHTVTISTEEVYLILEARRNLQEGRVGITAQLDTQLAIYTIHADSPYQDIPHEDHTDTIHQDTEHGNVAHGDDPYIDHTDNYYTDHTDEVYTDWEYEDAIYQDYHDHTDNQPHQDTPYSDHDDSPYWESPYVDTGHVDHTDETHTDSHTNISHIDSEV